jgi:membrane protein
MSWDGDGALRVGRRRLWFADLPRSVRMVLVRIVDRFDAAYARAVTAARKRSSVFDHAWQAIERFNDVLGGRLAAAISYYGFFAAFSLGVVAYSVLRRLVGPGQGGLIGTINRYLDALPLVTRTASQAGARELTVVGAVALILTGVGWVEALRSSQRAVWLLDQHPGNWFIRRVVDLGMLVGLGLLFGLSMAMTAAVDNVLTHLAGTVPPGVGGVVVRLSGAVLQFVVNLILAAAVLAAVPRLRLGARRLIPAALVVAVGIQLLNSVGRWYVVRTESRPAYQLAAGAVGLLIYLYLLNQLILFGAALAATAPRGAVVDLAAGPSSVSPKDDRPSAHVGEPRERGGPYPR